MTKTQAQALTMEQAGKLYYAYTSLMDAFEETYNGIHGARQFKEYHALRDSQQNCYNRWNELYRQTKQQTV